MPSSLWYLSYPTINHHDPSLLMLTLISWLRSVFSHFNVSPINRVQMTPHLWQEAKKNWRASWWKQKKRVEKGGLKLSIQKTKIMASGPIALWQIDGETVETVRDFIFWSSKITADGDCSHEIKRHLLLGRKLMTKLDSILKSRDILCQQKSISSKLWFFRLSCMDVIVGL